MTTLDITNLNADEIEKVEQSLTALESSEGWKVIVAFLQNNIDKLSESLLSPSSTLTMEEFNRNRDKLNMQKRLIEIPKVLKEHINSSAYTDEDAEKSLDVFE